MNRLGTFAAIAALAAAAGAAPLRGAASTQCAYPALRGQQRDEATIERLEVAWSEAFVRGDGAFERCLLTPGYTEIRRDGKVFRLADELALAAANRGKHMTLGTVPPMSVLMYGNTAVVYYAQRRKNGTMLTSADILAWDGREWRVVFSQQTAH